MICVVSARCRDAIILSVCRKKARTVNQLKK